MRVRSIAPENAQGEYYLPDLVAHLSEREADGVETVTCRRRRRDSRHQQPRRAGRGQPNRAIAEERRADGRRRHASRIRRPTYIDRDVEVGADTIIHPGVSLEGTTTIGAGCEIHSGVRIVNSRIGDRVSFSTTA